jgi:hypothetical protein
MKATAVVFLVCVLVNAQTPKKVTLQKSKSSDQLVIHTQKGFSTLVEFPSDQRIVEVTCGDKEFWVVEASGRFLHIKPSKEGLVTNLNVMIEGDVVYTFLLKEISKSVTVKDGPDLRVTVNGGDDVSKLRGAKERLEEALAKSERALKELNDKYESDRQHNAKKDDPWQPGADEEAENRTAEPEKKPEKPAGMADAAKPAVAPVPPLVPTRAAPVWLAQAPIASSYVIQRKGGFVRASGRFFKRIVQRVNRLIHSN